MFDTKEPVGLSGCLTALVLMVYGPVVWGFVLVHFWAWFILPVFITLPVLTLGPAVGLWEFATLSTVLNGRLMADNKTETRSFRERVMMALVSPWMFLMLGWIVQHWTR